MPATKVGKIQSARYHRASNGSLIKPTHKSNTDRCIEYIEDVKGDKMLQNDLKQIENDIEAKSNGTQEFLINYAFNKHKCYDNDTKTMLRTAINCSSIDSAKAEFKDDEMAYYKQKIESGNSKNINKAFHIINSFKDHSVPAAKVHAIGEEFARRLIGNSFKAVVSTHTNTDHYHNHIVINAYATDGAYKFRDSWNLGLQLQRIANELSLENGIEIISEKVDTNTFELDEDKLTFSQIRDRKMASKGSFKKQLMDDIILTAKSTNNWDEYQNQMTKKGYVIKKNTKSITYFHKSFGAIRDNRLGYQFTKPYIESYFIERQEFDDYSNLNLKINLKNLYVPKYIGTGTNRIRIPAILRLIKYLISIFKEIIDAEPQIYQKNRNFNKENVIKIKNQLKNLIKIENLLKQYEINNFSALKIKKNLILKDYVALNNLHKQMTGIIKRHKTIEKAINHYNIYKNTIKELEIKESELNLYDYGTANILENKAALNPLTPKTKSRLYKALYNSGYVLKYQYNQITEEQAKEICYFLSEQKTKNQGSTTFVHPVDKNLPDTIYTLKEYMKLKKAGKLPVYSKTPMENNFKTLDYDKLKEKHPSLIENNESAIKTTYKTSITIYREAMLKLRSYGINNEKQMNDFKTNQIDILQNNYDSLTKNLSELKSALNDLSNIESFYNGTYENMYKPIKMLSEQDIISDNIKSLIRDNSSIVEQLICLKNTLQNLDLSVLNDKDIIIAPTEILTVANIALMIQGKDISIKDMLKLDKSQLKDIITNFINTYDINTMLTGELKLEERLSKDMNDRINDRPIQKDNTKRNSIDKDNQRN